MSDEDRFRHKRSRRAQRVLKWMRNENSQMWGTVGLVVVTPLCGLIADLLQDQHMFAQDRADGGDEWRPWQPPPKDPMRPIPTLFNFMSRNVAALRITQKSIFDILTQETDKNFIIQSFPRIDPALVFGALQSQVLETLTDVSLRFTDPYTSESEFPSLVKMAMPEDELHQLGLDKHDLATVFHALHGCGLKRHSTANVKQMYPTAEAIVGDDAQEFLRACGHHQPICTKVVEFTHRSNRAVATARGPAKPSDIHTMADGFIISRLQVLHSQTLSKGGRKNRRNRFRFKHHPQVRKALKTIKKPRVRTKKDGSNPKWFYLNEERRHLKRQGLSQDEFYQAVRQKTLEYDTNEGVRGAARDRWLAAKAGRAYGSASAACGNQSFDDQNTFGESRGPWKMGDSFWPISEEHVKRWLTSESAMGGMRAAADKRRAEQCDRLFFGDDKASRKVPQLRPVEKSCFELLPGFCREGDQDVAEEVAHGVQEFHQIRYLLHSLILHVLLLLCCMSPCWANFRWALLHSACIHTI